MQNSKSIKYEAINLYLTNLTTVSYVRNIIYKAPESDKLSAS